MNAQRTAADWLDSFLKQSRPALRRVCLRWARGNRADADDLLSDGVMRLMEAHRASRVPIENPMAWLVAVIANLGRDRLRTNSRRGVSSLGETELEQQSRPGSGPDSTAIARCELQELSLQLRHLTAPQSEALLARGLGSDYADIAESLCVSSANARKLVQLARAGLRSASREHQPSPSIRTRRTPSRSSWLSARRSTRSPKSATPAT
jgi:RNA polymerase sigma factor (sigma-70 family)